jgi:hypothetical protein
MATQTSVYTLDQTKLLGLGHVVDAWSEPRDGGTRSAYFVRFGHEDQEFEVAQCDWLIAKQYLAHNPRRRNS